MTTPVSSMGLVLTGSLIGSFGAVFLKSGALALKPEWRKVVLNWRLALGVGFYLLSSVFFVMGMAHGELSVLYPMVSLGYICTLLWSRLFFREQLTVTKFAGVGLILAGIVLLSLGNR